jgi:hypothetical protein
MSSRPKPKQGIAKCSRGHGFPLSRIAFSILNTLFPCELLYDTSHVIRICESKEVEAGGL